MAIYSLNQLRAEIASHYGAHWEKSSDAEVICFYVRRTQESKSDDWRTINAPDVAKYFGVKAPSSCLKTSSEIDLKVKKSSESFFKGWWGMEEAQVAPNYHAGLGGNSVLDGAAMSVLVFCAIISLLAKVKKL